MGPVFNVESSDWVVRVPTVGSSGVPPDVDAVRTIHYPNQSVKSLMKPFLSITLPLAWIHGPKDTIRKNCGVTSLISVSCEVARPSLESQFDRQRWR